MKYISKLVLCIGIATIFVVGCDTKELHDLNNNPQAVNQMNLNFLFTPTQLAAAGGGGAGDNRFIDWRTNIGMCSYAIQHLANAGGGIAPGDKYTDNFEINDAPFQFFYGDHLQHMAEIIKETGTGGYDEGNKKNLRSAARIFRAWIGMRATDYYGSVPWFEAESVTNTSPIYYPKYDKQKAIYTDILNELDLASADLDATRADEGFGAADLYYNGDISKWKKWGYSLLLRAAMRISIIDPATASTYIAKAVAGGVMASNADNTWVPTATGPSVWTNQNGLSRAFYPNDGGQPTIMGKTLIDWLKGANAGITADDDPRLMILSGGIGNWSTPNGVSTWTPKPNGLDPLKQHGMPNGMDPTLLENYEGTPGVTVDQDATYSKINIKMLDLDDPFLLMSYGEVELLLAEASQRGLGGLTAAAAQGHYNAGVKASMQMYTPYDASLTVSDAAVTAYLTTYPYGVNSPNGPADGLHMIAEQLWANHFANWYESWSEWRRTQLPVLVPTNYPGNVTGGTIPQRLKIPTGELAANPNAKDGATQPNQYTTKVWWAGGPE